MVLQKYLKVTLNEWAATTDQTVLNIISLSIHLIFQAIFYTWCTHAISKDKQNIEKKKKGGNVASNNVIFFTCTTFLEHFRLDGFCMPTSHINGCSVKSMKLRSFNRSERRIENVWVVFQNLTFSIYGMLLAKKTKMIITWINLCHAIIGFWICLFH